jgi:hypothetical protein
MRSFSQPCALPASRINLVEQAKTQKRTGLSTRSGHLPGAASPLAALVGMKRSLWSPMAQKCEQIRNALVTLAHM